MKRSLFLAAAFVAHGATGRTESIDCAKANRFYGEKGSCGACFDGFQSNGGYCVYLANHDVPTFEEVTNAFGNPFTRVDVAKIPTLSRLGQFISFADLSKKGVDDVYINSFYDKEITILKNDGNGTLSVDNVGSPFTGLKFVGGVTFGDVNGDGLTDAMAILRAGRRGSLMFFKGSDGGGLERATLEDSPIQLQDELTEAVSVNLVDLDGDGDMDAVFHGSEGRTWYFENKGTATNPNFVLQTDAERNPFAKLDFERKSGRMAFEDLDQDGDMDLLFGTQEGLVYYFRNDQGTFVRISELKSPFGHFIACQTREGSVVSPSCWAQVAFGNLDGNRDLYLGTLGSPASLYVRRFRNLGTTGRTNFWLHKGSESAFVHLNDYIETSFDRSTIAMDVRAGFRVSTACWKSGASIVKCFVGLYDGTMHLVQSRFGEKFEPLGPVLQFEDRLWVTVSMDTEDMILYVASSLRDVLAYKVDAELGTLQPMINENPFDGLEIPGDNVTNEQKVGHKISFADVDGNGRKAYIVATTELLCFTKSESGKYENCVNNPLGDSFLIEGLSSIAFLDVDHDGLLDAVISAGGSVSLIRNHGSIETPLFIVAEDWDNPFKEYFVRGYGSLDLFDFDLDGDLDLAFGNTDGVMEIKNTGRDCATFCSGGRGFCAINTDKQDLTPVYSASVSSFQDLGASEVKAGKCSCDPIFEGVACERCAANRFGKDCEFSCPNFSRTLSTEEKIAIGFMGSYPHASADDCICDPTFVRKNLSLDERSDDGRTFECVCPEGWGYASGLKLCQKCERGFYKNVSTVEQCFSCNWKDPYVSTEDVGSVSSSSCGCKATFVFHNGHCVCPPGFGFNINVQVCEQCAPETYSDRFALDGCKSCEPNFTTFFAQSIACEAILCPLGYQRNVETLLCEPCKVGWYRDEHNDACQICPPKLPLTLSTNTTTSSGCLAAAGSFSMDGTSFACSSDELKDKVSCLEPGVTLETLPINDGFWRISSDTTDIRECPKQTYCIENKMRNEGGEGGRKLSYAKNEASPKCTTHHKGILCVECEEGYAISGSGRCEECSDDRVTKETSAFAGLVSVAVILTILPLIAACFLTLKGNKPKDPEKNTRTPCCSNAKALLGRLMNKLNLVKSGFRILIGFLQVYWQFIQLNSLYQNDNASTTFSIFLNLDVTAIFGLGSFPCVVETNFYTRLLIATVWPLCLVFLLIMVYFFLNFVFKKGPEAFLVTSSFIIQMLLLVYPRVSSITLSTFLYDEFPLTRNASEVYRSLRDDYTVDYEDDSSALWRVYAGIMVLIYPIGVVIVFFLCARWSARYFLSREGSGNPSQKDDENQPFEFLVKPYKTSRSWYESVDLIRKLSLTGCFVLVAQESLDAANAYFTCMCGLSIVIFYRLDPYKSMFDTHFSEASMFLLFLLGYVPFLGSQADLDEKQVSGITLGIVILEFALFAGYLGLVVTDEIRADDQPKRFVDPSATHPGNTGSFVVEGSGETSMRKDNQNRLTVL